MKIPHSAFALINVVVRMLLRSPLHGWLSDSILLINYTGRSSGRAFSTPVRYAKIGAEIRCVSSREIQWWRNLRANPRVTLLVAGSLGEYAAQVRQGDAEKVLPLLREFLTIYPQDAVYQDIRTNPDGSLNEDDLASAAQQSVVVEFSRS